MIYPKNTFSKLGLDQLLDLTASRCETLKAKGLVNAIQFTSDPELVKQRLNQGVEMKRILEDGGLSVHFQLELDLDHKVASSTGFFYEEEVLVQMQDLLRASQKVHQFFLNKEEYPELAALFDGINLDYSIVQLLEKSLDTDGQVSPSASPKLHKLYAEIRRMEKKVNSQSQTLFANHKDNGLLAETEMTIKNGRVVFPVLSEHKRKVEGLLIDQSASGKISYIEPLSLVRLNNELSEAQIHLRQEVIVVLRAITKRIVPEIPALIKMTHQLAAFDLIRAKSRLALDYRWEAPKVDAKETNIKSAVHPLLQIKLREEGAKAVPLDINFTEDQRLVVISGPNAGGKSVALKTVGLIHLMVQCGFMAPLAAESTVKIYENIFVDIGDDQSIESDLSTYTSHLKAAKHIVNFCDEDSLVLIDEIGTGTDPMFGGPMAQAIVEEIHDRSAYGVITTHFSNIKSTAKRLRYAVNAAMLFDTKALKPLYELSLGQAGSSFSFEVARNIGLNKSLIKKAKSYTDTRQYDLDLLLAEVQQQKEELLQKMKEAERLKASGEQYEQDYKSLKETLSAQQVKLIEQAKQEANRIISASNKEVERTIRTIKETQADTQKTKQVRKRLAQQKLEVAVKETKLKSPFKVGDRVQIKDSSTIGEILSIDKKNVALAVGSVKTKTKLTNIEKVGAAQEKKVKKYISETTFTARQESFNATLDVRGMRTQEAISELDQWIDSAVMLGFQQLRLLHGKGQGILRQQLRGYLKNNPIVVSMAYEPENQGGQGVSLITLN